MPRTEDGFAGSVPQQHRGHRSIRRFRYDGGVARQDGLQVQGLRTGQADASAQGAPRQLVSTTQRQGTGQSGREQGTHGHHLSLRRVVVRQGLARGIQVSARGRLPRRRLGL